MDSQRLDHWRTVSWDPGIVDSRVLSVCYDCLCLMALFRAVMSLVHHWAEWCVWIGPDAGYCRTIAWEEQYLPRLHPSCVVDRLCSHSTEIKVPGFVHMLNRGRNISSMAVCLYGVRCTMYAQDFAGGLLHRKDFAHAEWLLCLCGWFGGLF